MKAKIARFLDLDVLTRITLFLSGVLLLVTCFNVTYGVIMRYVFDNPSIQAIELTKILLIPALVLAVSYVQWNDRHLKVDFLYLRFPKKMQCILSEILVPIMGLYVVYILVLKGWDSAVYSFQIGEKSMSVWSEPLYPVRFTIPIGYGILGLVLIVQLVNGVRTLFGRKKKEEPETRETTTQNG